MISQSVNQIHFFLKKIADKIFMKFHTNFIQIDTARKKMFFGGESLKFP